MLFLRACTRSTSKNQFLPLHNQHEIPGYNDNISRDGFQPLDHLSDWKEAGEYKVDTESWIGSYCHSDQGSNKGKRGKSIRSRLTSSNSSQKYCTRSLRKRLAGVSFFQCKHHQSSITTPPMSSPVFRPSTSDAVFREKPKMVVTETIRERSVSSRGSRYNDKWQFDDELSPVSTISDEKEKFTAPPPMKKKKKVRQVTRYHNPKVIDPRTPKAAHYYSSQTGKSQSLREGTIRGHSSNKSSVGRHLEWLKFLA